MHFIYFSLILMDAKSLIGSVFTFPEPVNTCCNDCKNRILLEKQMFMKHIGIPKLK